MAYLSNLAVIFQLTTSRRGRPIITVGTSSVKDFNSRPHEEVDSVCFTYDDVLENFNSRPHEEVDYRQLSRQSGIVDFNSRPHEEVDDNECP